MSSDREKIAKRRQRRRRRRLKPSFKIFLFFMILLLGGCSYLGIKYYQAKNAPDPYGKLDDIKTPKDSTYDLTEDVMPAAKYWVLNVGDGDAIYIQCGNTDILIDTGADSKAEEIIKTIKGEIRGDLDYLFITSTSDRRIGGIHAVCTELKPQKIISCPLGDKERGIRQAAAGIVIEEGTNTTIPFDENAALTIFVPEVSSQDPLDHSLMTFFRYGDTSFFAESDAGEEEEARVIEQIGQCDALVLARGGSDKVNQHVGEITCQTFIASCTKEAKPSDALIKTINGTVYATYSSGTIQFTTDGKEVTSNLDRDKELKEAEREQQQEVNAVPAVPAEEEETEEPS